MNDHPYYSGKHIVSAVRILRMQALVRELARMRDLTCAPVDAKEHEQALRRIEAAAQRGYLTRATAERMSGLVAAYWTHY